MGIAEYQPFVNLINGLAEIYNLRFHLRLIIVGETIHCCVRYCGKKYDCGMEFTPSEYSAVIHAYGIADIFYWVVVNNCERIADECQNIHYRSIVRYIYAYIDFFNLRQSYVDMTDYLAMS